MSRKRILYTLPLAIMGIILPQNVHAEPFVYSPKECEISITFPEKPFIQEKCSGNDATKTCTEIVTFTKTDAEAGASIGFRVTCHSDDPKELEKYTPPIMEETLRKMMKDGGMEPYNITSSEDSGFKKASSISLSQKDGKTNMYSGQIWIGKTSIFTMEADMTGPKNDKLDNMFADILRHTVPKNITKEAPLEKKN